MAREAFSRRSAAALIAAGFAWPRLAQAATPPVDFTTQASRLTPAGPPAYKPSASLATVADMYRRMTVPIRVNGQGPFAFVVDTGANQSVIALELAVQLGLVAGPTEPLNGVAGVQDEPTTRAQIDVGGRIRTEVTLSMLPRADLGGEGLLGIDGLEGQRLTLDFRGQTMRIEGGRRRSSDPDEIAVRAKRRSGQLTLVDADLAGLRVTAFLDSGAQNTIGNMALRSMALTRNPMSLWTQTPILSATGQTILAELADLPNLRIGRLHLPNWPVAFADLHTFRMWNLEQEPAILIGVDVLSRFQYVRLDFARDEVAFLLPESA